MYIYILSTPLDYCDCLLMGTPDSVIQPLQKIQNFATVLLAPHHHHTSPFLEKTTLASHFRTYIEYKVACMCFSDINGSGPAYLPDITIMVDWALNTKLLRYCLPL